MANLLVMDDDLIFGYGLSSGLQRAGHTVQICTTGSEARAELERATYEALITDIVVRLEGKPVPDGGLSLISWIRSPRRKNIKLQSLPIIATSGTYKNRGMQQILTTAEQLGANASIQKPIDIDLLCEMIEDLCNPQESQRLRRR